MPSIYSHTEQPHTEEIHDIISSPPAWLLRWGISLFFALLILLVGLSAAIRYPDTIKTQLKINSYNSPKPVVTKVSGKLVKIIIDEKQNVGRGQVLAYIESTADHEEVLHLLVELKRLQNQFYREDYDSFHSFKTPVKLQLGELQNSYQSFYQFNLAYKASIEGGFYLKKRAFLQKELSTILSHKDQLLAQQALQERDYRLAKEEYVVHQKLVEQNVEAPLDLKREESKLLAKEYPLQQTKFALIENASAYAAKEREILELDNQIKEEKLIFAQALSTLISHIEDWKSKYVLSASQSGTVTLSGIIQENQFLNANQEVFYVNPGDAAFFGEMDIPQYNMGKIKEGQKVLVRLRSYPYEEYGIIWGKLEHISDVPFRDSIYVSRVTFINRDLLKMERPIKLKNGMLADAEIITEDASLLGRLSRSLIKLSM